MNEDRINLITKYNIAASICGKVYNQIKHKILYDKERDILTLTSYGNQCILDELSIIFKKEKDKHIAFPVSISLNNCVGNYIYDYQNKDSEYNTIKTTDIIKIELGVSISGCISILADTFIIDDNPEIKRIIDFLDNMQQDLVKKIKHEETADEMRILIESKCTENNIFPIENCMSYQQSEGYLNGETLKYMILNYRKYYDNDDYLISPENINYEFEENDIYTINLSVVPTNNEIEDFKYKNNGESHIYRFNEYTYSLKLKNSRNFYNQVKLNHKNYAFDISPYYKNIKNKMGIKECLNNNILETYPILYIQPSNIPVITKKFTIIVGKNNSKVIKYY
jgi:methionine aminopeptidase